MTFHIGFTGTREDMTAAQRESFKAVILAVHRGRDISFHHGACVGADEEAELLLSELSLTEPLSFFSLTRYPADVGANLRAKGALGASEFVASNTTVKPDKPPLERNKDIVNASDIMIACPKEPLEVLRSGTWATIRYARKIQRPLYLILPDGTVKEERT